MHRTTVLALSALALTTLLGGPAVATGTQPPLPDAGLDQSVERGATVQLDANGSRDPDGSIASVRWSIEAPDGTTRTPDCPSCVQTTFSPTDTGQYNVTVTITDDAGVSRSDTLRVDVVAPGGPSVLVSAPPAVHTGTKRNLTANVSAGDANLRTLAWVVNGTAQNQTRLAGENGSSTITHTFDDSGSVSVRAVAYDAAGRRGADNQTVQVVDSSGGGGGGGGGGGANCPGGSGNYYNSINQNQGCTSAAMTIDDTIVDTDGREGLWVYVDSELTKIAAEDRLNKLSKNGYGKTFSKKTVDQLQEDYRKEQNKAYKTDSGSDDEGGDEDGGTAWYNRGSDDKGSTGESTGVKERDTNNFGSENDFNYDPASRETGTEENEPDNDGYSFSYNPASRDSGGSNDGNGLASDDGGGSVNSGDFGGAFDGYL